MPHTICIKNLESFESHRNNLLLSIGVAMQTTVDIEQYLHKLRKAYYELSHLFYMEERYHAMLGVERCGAHADTHSDILFLLKNIIRDARVNKQIRPAAHQVFANAAGSHIAVFDENLKVRLEKEKIGDFVEEGDVDTANHLFDVHAVA